MLQGLSLFTTNYTNNSVYEKGLTNNTLYYVEFFTCLRNR